MADKFIAKIMDQDVFLILVDAANYQPVILKILDKLVVKNKMKGIYVAMNKPYKTLTKNFTSQGISKDKLFFLDSLTKSIRKEKKCPVRRSRTSKRYLHSYLKAIKSWKIRFCYI